MKNIFNMIKLTKPGYNVFDLTHDVKMSAQLGDLTPIMCQECVPGDKFTIGCESLIRFAPLVAPIMHRVDVTMHYFFVPNRIVWNGWEDFITGTGSKAFPVIGINKTVWDSSRLPDYMGIPDPEASGNSEVVNAIPFAAYQAIYNEYYRDQNLQNEIDYQLVDGAQPSASPFVDMRKRAWEHDYFTSALPFAQKGDAVSIPLGTIEDDVEVLVNDSVASPYTTLSGVPNNVDVNSAPTADVPANQMYAATEGAQISSTTINDLRRAFRLQEWLEKNARGGTRYIENILSHFGVRSSDRRLQRPEYITGIKTPVQISEVLNTSATSTEPQGNMSGHGITHVQGNYGNYRCEEHGFIIGIMSVLPKTAYQQGLEKFWLKTADQFQYYWPSFAHIGEQEVLNKEVYAFQGSTGVDTFGYVPRYAEYKFANNRVAGDFRNTLDHWHWGRIFASAPALNATFIQADPSTRVFAVEDAGIDKLYCHVLNKVRAVRPMPKFGTPTF